MLLKELYAITSDQKTVIQFLQSKGLLMRTPSCTICGNPMKIHADVKVKSGYVYECQNRTVGNRHGTK